MKSKILLADDRFPSQLKEIKDPPKVLYYKGVFNNTLFDKCLAVIGSRNITPYGSKVIDNFFEDLKNSDLTIVSGFMTGVDAYAHTQALKIGLKTVAVLPCGIDLIYPSEQHELYQEIQRNGGLLMSEYPGIYPPKNWTYPRRNRIVAGLCRAVLVVEAGSNSGSLLTAELAAKYNRRVLAVPGNIYSNSEKGICQLLKTIATPIDSADDIKKIFNIKIITHNFSEKITSNKSTQKSDTNQEHEEALKIVSLLKSEHMTIDQISVALNKPISQVSTWITLLSLNDLVNECGGYYYAS